MLRTCQFLTILTSKSLWRAGGVQFLRSSTSKSAPTPPVFNDFDFQIVSRAGVVQILRSSTSKSAPNMPVFNDFDFQIALARRRGANFVDILGSRSFATPVFRTYLCEPSKRQSYGKNTAFRAIPTRQNLSDLASALSNISAVKHRCCKAYRQLSV